MRYNGILVQGYCRDEFQSQMNPMESVFEEKERKYEKQKSGFEDCLEARRMNFYMDVTFLTVYGLVSREEFFLWMECIEHQQKERWRELYYLSEYNNKQYEAFFDMRAGAEVEWLTGMLVRIKQGGQKEYWELMNGIAMIYPWERRYIQKRSVIKIEELLCVVKSEENEILKAGKLLMLLLMAEFYHKQITRNDIWNRLEIVLWKGLEFYQRNQWSVDRENPFEFRKILEDNFMKHGIHPIRLQKYVYPMEEVPVFEEKLTEENWNYLWQMMWALQECIKENKEDYKILKQRVEKQVTEDSEKSMERWRSS